MDSRFDTLKLVDAKADQGLPQEYRPKGYKRALVEVIVTFVWWDSPLERLDTIKRASDASGYTRSEVRTALDLLVAHRVVEQSVDETGNVFVSPVEVY